MIQRAISSGNRFAYCSTVMNSNGARYQPYEKDVVCLVRIKECQFLPDSRCLMEGVVERRIAVASSWVEKGTQGLWYVKYADFEDVAADAQAEGEALDATHVAELERF